MARKGDIVHLVIEDVTFGSEGIARLDGQVVFVPAALPGEEVEARIVQRKRDFLRAQIVEWKTRSGHRLQPPCPHFAFCGGCVWQDVAYEYQLQLKHRIVAETLRRIGGFGEVPIHPVLASPQAFRYRNKMEFSFSAHRWILPDEPDPLPKPRDFALGFHIPGRYDKVLDIDACWLQSEENDQILQAVKAFALESGKTPWNTRTRSGFWRFLVLREGKNTGQRMINLVTYEHDSEINRRFLAFAALHSLPYTTLVNNATKSLGGVAFGESEVVLDGPGIIHETLGKFTFEISANSFFQTNSLQAENLYRKAVEFARLTGAETVFDLYCGTGSIAIFVSPYARRVVGIELVEAAVTNARRNAALNGVNNCTFEVGDIGKEFRRAWRYEERYAKPDVVIVDPPRAGVHPNGLKGILALKPERVVYVSCNPSTFARDARFLVDSGYDLVQVQPVDMFPHTAHIELVAELVKR
jgi:23S rRNA (uracil1939-C5)-methyltransferase